MRVRKSPAERGCAVVAANWAGGVRSEAWVWVSAVKIGALARLIPREVVERTSVPKREAVEGSRQNS